jgi:hypothetical protein
MTDILKAVPHLITACLVIAAATVLACLHIISGGEAIGLIGMGGGFTLGGTVASGSVSTGVAAGVAASQSGSGPTQTTPLPTSLAAVPSPPVRGRASIKRWPSCGIAMSP